MRFVSLECPASRFQSLNCEASCHGNVRDVLMAELYGRASGGRTLYRSSEGENMQIKQSQWRGRRMENVWDERPCDDCGDDDAFDVCDEPPWWMQRFFSSTRFIYKYSDWCSNNSFKYFPCWPSGRWDFSISFRAAWKWPVMYGSAEDSIISISISSIHSCGSFLIF